MPKLFKITHNLLCEKCQKSRFFVEGFWSEFYAHGRFMKYSMSGWGSKGILEFRFGQNLGLRLEAWPELNKSLLQMCHKSF